MNGAQGGWQDEVLRELRGSAPTPAGPDAVPNANDATEPGTTADQNEVEGAGVPLTVHHPVDQRSDPGQPSPPRTAPATTPGETPRHRPETLAPLPGQLPQPVPEPRPLSPHALPYSDATALPVPAQPRPSPTEPHPQLPSTAPGMHAPLPDPRPNPQGQGAPAVRHRPGSPGLPFPTPESVPTVDPRLALALGKPSHGDSVARRTGESIRRLTSSASQEVTEETRIGRELQQPVTTGRVIAVTSIRGGVGKTTTAALLARTFNHYRHDPVLALEADAALGTLPVRMGAESVRWSCAELARILTPSMQLTDITGYLVPVSDGGWLLPASQGRLGAPLDIPTYRTVTLALRRYFAVTVVDCETLPGEVARTAMDTAHARVVVAPLTAEGVGGTRVVLDWLAQLPHEALAFTVVALTSGTPDLNLDLKTATAHLRETGVTIVHLPYDRHLAAGGPIRTELLGSATRRAATQLAAEALQRAVRVR
ncbi:MinD/ParA family ATP-binding protein [Streptomyces prunicolor]|uniref:MinD/ParA family ATP-binding protein n=1 Tax=Streptomyces prunicolor TaxID=67348 RepID=UPI0003AACB52|nr:MinD/ParA family protein [Streptomyces prunicolor]